MFSEVNSLIENRLFYNWVTTPIDYDNVEYKPVRGNSFVRLAIEWVDSQAVSIGGLSRGAGYVDVSIFAPSNTGVQLINALADEIASLYNKWAYEGLRFRVARTVRVGQQEEWYQLKVLIPFTFDECNDRPTGYSSCGYGQ